MKIKLLFLSLASVTTILAAISTTPKTPSLASTTASVPVAFYHADPGADCTVNNSSVCGRDETGQHNATVPVTDSTNYPGMNFTTGKVGQAFHFTGPINLNGSQTGTYVDFGSWWDSESFTIAMWMKDDASPMSPQSTSVPVLALAHDSGSNDWSITYNNSVGQYVYTGADGAQITFNVPSAKWVQLTITRSWDGTTGVTNLYLNGGLVGSATKSASVLGSPPINLGVRAGADFNLTNYWKGEIDELRFYNNVISAGELAALQPDFDPVRDFFRYTNPAPTPSSTPQVWQYGFSATDGSGFTNFPNRQTDGISNQSQPGLKLWNGQSDMGAVINDAGTNVSYNSCTLQQPDVLGMFPGNDGRKNVVRWTAPETGTYSIQGRFQNIDTTSADVSIVQNGNTAAPLFSDELDGGACNSTNVTKPFSVTATVNAGDTIDFRVGIGTDGSYTNDGTGLATTITKQLSCAPLPSGMVGWWPGEGNGNDIQGSDNGTLQGGATFATGKVGQAFSFNGVDGFVDFPSVPLTATDNWTVEAWINPASLPQLAIAVDNGYDDCGATGDGYSFGVGDGAGGSGYKLQGLFNGVSFLDTGYTFPAANQWYHVAMVRSSGTTSFYVNGVQTPNTFTVNPNTPSQTFRIGSQTGGSHSGCRFFNGLVDEVQVYNRALSQAEIQNTFNAGSAGVCPLPTPAFGNNLIINGDAELGSGSNDGSTVPVPAWAVTGAFTSITYNNTAGFPTASDPGPPNRGANFFAGGNAALSTATQSINVSNLAADIDAGASFALSGYLGGYQGQDDCAKLVVTFRGSNGNNLGTAQIGPVIAADRGNVTGLFLRSASGSVPTGTRAIDVLVQMNRAVGTANDGYADNLSLVLTAGSGTCPTGETNCAGQCVNLQTDPNNCGTCGNVCPPGWLCSAGGCINPNASPTPTATATATPITSCPAGFADCDGNPANGCEVNLNTDSQNCGACGHNCPAGFVCSAGGCVPATPPHGGLSTTALTVDGSNSPQPNLADTVLHFAAEQTGRASNLIVRVQWGTSSNQNDPSWTDLPNGNNGHMSFDPGSSMFVLNTLNYPEQGGVYFRAISSGSGYSDSISNIVGPFDLSSSKPHVPPTRLYVTGNGPNADLYFLVNATNPPSGVAVRVQSSTNPDDEFSWTDLGYMNRSANSNFANLFILLENNLPTACGVSFRAVSSLSGSVDSISNVVGPFDLVQDVPPSVSITAPAGFGGNPYDPNNPWIVEAGYQTFSATVRSNNTVDVLRILADYDQLSLVEYDFPVGDGTTSYSATFNLDVGDHVIEGVAADQVQGCNGEPLHAIGRNGTSPVYVRVVPQGTYRNANRNGPSDASTPKVFHSVNDGYWDDSNTWSDQFGIPGVPTFGDSAIIEHHTIHFNDTRGGSAASVFLNDATLVTDTGTASALYVSGRLTINSCTVIGGLGIFIQEGAVGNLNSPSDVTFQSDATTLAGRGEIFAGGTLNIHGAGGAIGASNIIISHHRDGTFGVVNWLPPLQSLPNANIDPTVGTRVLQAGLISNAGQIRGTAISLISQDGGGLISQDGGGLISQDGGGIVAQGGGNIVAQGGGNIVAQGGGNIVAQGGGNIVAQGGGNIVAQGGGNIVAQGGGNLQTVANRANSGMNAPAGPTGFVQNGGNTDLNSFSIVGAVTLNGGTLSGSGLIQGDVTNNGGMIAPGHSGPGTIVVNGNFSQGSNGSLLIKDGGKSPSKFDQLHVAGSANLGGKLGVYKINGFTPDPQDTFSPLGYNSVNGNFDTVSADAAQNANVTPNGLLLAVDPNVSNPFTVVADPAPGDGGSVTGAGPYDSGSEVTLTATPSDCYSFVNWTENGNVVSTSPTYGFTASADRTLVANFAKIQYAISASASPAEGGSVTGTGNQDCGSTVTLQATPSSSCYAFANWTDNGNVVSTSPTYSFTAGSNRALVANFTKTDTTPPVITTPGNIEAKPQKTKRGAPKGAIVSFNVTAFDLEDGTVPAIVNPPSGSFFPLGTTTVTVTATDGCNNTSRGTFTVTVGNGKHGRH